MRISDLSSDVGSSDLGFRAPPKLWRKRLYVQISLRDDPACENDAGRFVRFRNAISVYGKGMVGTAQDMDARSEERRVGKGVSVRVDLGGRRLIKKKNR